MNANKDSTSRQIEFGVVIISTYTDEITIAFGIPVDEHGTPKKLTQGDVILFRDFIHCFRFQPVQRNVIEGKFVQDQAVQRITSPRPPPTAAPTCGVKCESARDFGIGLSSLWLRLNGSLLLMMVLGRSTPLARS